MRQVSYKRIFFLLFLLVLLSIPTVAFSYQGPDIDKPNDEIQFDVTAVPDEIRPAVIETIKMEREKMFPHDTFFVVGVFSQFDNWGYGSLAATSGKLPPDWGNSIWFIVHRDNQENRWVAALEGTADYDSLVKQAQFGLLPSEKHQFAPLDIQPQAVQSEKFKFPWHFTQQWRYTSSWHYRNALDFAPYNVARDEQWFLSSASGIARKTCDDGYQAWIRVENSTLGNTDYVHLATNTVPDNKINRNNSQGTRLGRAYDGNRGAGYYNIGSRWPWPSCNPNPKNPCNWGRRTGCCWLQYKTRCGAGTGAHFHWQLPSQNVTVDGWTIGPSGKWKKNNETRGVGAVFSSTNGKSPPPNHAPRTPTLTRPGDWAVTHDGRAPNLCWRNNGDPDGDSVKFRVVIYDSAVNADSGWISSTCWRPSKLDGHYYGYKWHVKARDSRGKESGWSGDWHFNIEAPNEPPSVSFDTANGNGASRIVSRDRDWLFRGSAHDKEGRLRLAEFRCGACDNKGGGSDSDGLSGRDDDWRITRTGMSGRNDVYFRVYDDKYGVDSRHLDLRIDLNAPATRSSLAGTRGSGGWYRSAVTVKLRAQDRATGRAAAGVATLHYRIDGGGWQTHNGASKDVTVSGNGNHTVEYYARDRVGNQESVHRITFKIDKDAPNPPPGVNETHGIASNNWQKDQNKPTFTWQASTDPVSGVWGYQLYFGPDPNGKNYQSFRASDARTWTPRPHGVPTGTYYLRGRTRDNAGNWSAWTTLYIFRYDGTPPDNPGEATHAAGVKNDTWQNVTSAADFTWPGAHDEGSGIQGYYLYWGTDPLGESANLITGERFQNPAALCGQNSTCVGYLRLRSKDNVGHEAEDWTTAFVLRYDNTPPTLDFTFSSGMTTTQTLLTLLIDAQDTGSGVKEMRISSDGQSWTNWEPYAEERPWVIPAISRQSWPVYVQVRDGVGLESPVVMHQVYLDVNAQQPRSLSYRLFDYAMSAGAGSHHSAGYQGHSTVGQVFGQPKDAPHSASPHYALTSGYEAASQALPLTVPGHDEYIFYNGIFASGVVAETMKSAVYQMRGVAGEPALPNNQTTLTSGSYQHLPGFLAAEPGVLATPTPTPSPTPTPTPTPGPKCEFPQITINEADLYTNDPHVTLSICAPNAVEMMVSNDGGFVNTQWEPYAETKAWTITTYGDYVLPRYVYVVFKNADGSIHGTYFDDIIYDPNPPTGGISTDESMPDLPLVMAGVDAGGPGDKVLTDIGSAPYIREINGVPLARPLALQSLDEEGAVNIYVNAQDDNSGIAKVQLSASEAFTDTEWQPYSALLPFEPDEGDGVKSVYARFQDDAGNISDVAQTSFVLDTLAPFGGIAMEPYILGPDVITSTVYLGADDNLSGLAEMRLSETPDFVDAPWQPYTTTVTWLVDVDNKTEGSLYVQYRDLAGNESAVAEHHYLVDKEPPLVYVEVDPSETLTQTLHIYAYDDLSDPDTMRLSNDPMMWENVVTMPYTDTVTWTFDDREVVWVQVKDAVGNWSEPYPAQAASRAPNSVQSITLSQGWTLMSFNRITASATVTAVMASMEGGYDRILGEDGSYVTTLPPGFNTLKSMEPGKAYWVHATNPGVLSVTGAVTDPGAPIELHEGWNWVGYLPEASQPVTQALTAIEGSYTRVIGDDGSFVVGLPPSFNTLKAMEPGKGYLIYMTQAATLTYPGTAEGLGALPAQEVTEVELCPDLVRTPYFREVYGVIDVAQAGQVLRAYDPRGLLVGCAQVRADGSYGLMRLYGGKEADDAATPGLLPGEEAQFALGDQTLSGVSVAWQPDYDAQRLDIPMPPVDLPNKLFLPSVQDSH